MPLALVSATCPRTASAPTPAPRRRMSGDARCRVAADIASVFSGVGIDDILSARRATAPIAHARHVAMYLAHVGFGMPLRHVAAGFGRDRTSIGYAVARIEDERDDGRFDAALTRMEQLVAACRSLAARDGGWTAG